MTSLCHHCIGEDEVVSMRHTVEAPCFILDAMTYRRQAMRLSLELLGYSLSRKTGVRIHARVKPTPGRRPRRGSFASGEGFGRPVLATESSIGAGCAAASDVYS